MKVPVSPPAWHELVGRIMKNPGSMQKVLSAGCSPIHKSRYVHWHKLRYREPPAGLSHEEWWATFKLARKSQLRQVPLRDRKGESFSFTMPDPVLEYLHYIDQNAAGRIEMLDEQVASPLVRDRYLVHSLIEEAITSSQLEGATSTRQVAKEMLRTQRPPTDTSERMILNNYLTMRLIRDHTQEPLTKELVFDFHRRLTEEATDDPSAPGRYRRQGEDIRVFGQHKYDPMLVHTPPHARELEQRMRLMCAFAEGGGTGFVHPVIRAIILHFWLAYDHPFVDGNGRCARALFYWMMLRQRYWLCEFISISEVIKHGPTKYGQAFLYTENDENDLTYFILYHLRVVKLAIEALHGYIARKTAAIRDTEALLRGTQEGLNYRQMTLLSHSLRHPDTRYTVRGFQKSNRVAYETARADLLGLAEKGLLDKRKVGKTYVFYAVEDLHRRIASRRPATGR
jgi:Fic family protein